MSTNKLVKYFQESYVNTDVFTKTSKDVSTDRVDNPFEYHKSKSSLFPIWTERFTVDAPDANSTLALSNTCKYSLPNRGVLKMLWQETVLAQTTTASYSDYVGGHLIKSFKVTHGQNTLFDVANYTLWREYLFKFLPYEVVTRILAIEGGSSITSTGGTITVGTWIPLPWDYFSAPEQGGLDLGLFDTKVPLILHITYNSATDITTPTGTGGAITSGRLIGHCMNTTNLGEMQSEKIKSGGFFLPCILPDMPGSTGATLATATETSYSMNDLTNHYKEIAIFLRLSSDITAKKWSAPLQKIDSCKHLFDNNEEIYFDSSVESNIINLEETSNYGYPIQFTNYPVILSYSQWDQHAKSTDITGYVTSNSAKNWNIKIKHTVGANCQLDFIGVYHAILMFEIDSKGRVQVNTLKGGKL